MLASFLINAWEGAGGRHVLAAGYDLRAEENGTPLEEFEEIVFEKLLILPRLPTLGGMNDEHLQ